LHNQKFEVMKTRERLKRERTTLADETRRRHALLDEQLNGHRRQQRVTVVNVQRVPRNTFQLEHALAHSAKLLQKTQPSNRRKR
jgi:hypothetical protein